MKSEKLELYGHRAEFMGLVFVLIGTLWNAQFSGWWDEQLPEWNYLIQTEMQIAQLSALANIGLAQGNISDEQKEQISQHVHNRASLAISNAMRESEKRRKTMSNGQAAWMSTVNKVFILLGAGLLVIGKWLSIHAVKLRHASL